MKKFTKICLIIVCISAVIGILGLCAGFMLGGSLYDYGKVGVFDEDGDVELFPQIDRMEDRIENNFDRMEDRIENNFDRVEERWERKMAPLERLEELFDF